MVKTGACGRAPDMQAMKGSRVNIGPYHFETKGDAQTGTGKGMAVLRKKLGYAMLAALLLITVLSGCFGRGGAGLAPAGEGTGHSAANPDESQHSTSNGATKPPAETGHSGQAAPPVEKPDPVAAQLGQLSLDEKIGQLVLVGMDGTAPTPQTKELIEQYHVGGFIFFKPNIENAAQAVALFNSLKETNRAANAVPLFLSVDEEGGRVSRLPNTLVKLPPNGAIGKRNDPAFTRALGGVLGQELRAFGLNVDFAPVLDVNSNPHNPAIGDRAFGSDAALVSRLGVPEMQGLQAERVIPVIKHFPGHGDTSVDSHLGLPIVQHDIERLRSLELIPFADAVRAGADMVMVAHILLPKLDADHPASFSATIISTLLRKELGFRGVVITDDLTMGAIVKHYDIGAAAVQAIKAGGNIVLVGHEFDKQKAVIQALKQAAVNGSLSPAEIDDRVYQILALKQKYRLDDASVKQVDVGQVNKLINGTLNRNK